MTRRQQLTASVGLIIGGALLAAAGTIAPGVGVALGVIGIAIGIRPVDEGSDDDTGPGDGASR